MTRTIPAPLNQAPGNLISGAAWNAGPAASAAFLNSVPIFVCSTTATTVVPVAGTGVPILFQNPLIDSEGGHSNVDNPTQYVCQVAGWYMVAGCVSWSPNNVGERSVAMKINGGGLIQGSGNTAGPGNGTTPIVVPTTPTLVRLNVSEYVELWGYHGSNVSLSTQVGAPYDSWFTAWWVGHV